MIPGSALALGEERSRSSYTEQRSRIKGRLTRGPNLSTSRVCGPVARLPHRSTKICKVVAVGSGGYARMVSYVYTRRARP